MSKDIRVVATDALETLGTIHMEPQHRDAIHLAVEPVVAGERLLPGDDIIVSFNDSIPRHGVAYKVLGKGDGTGIVDPFLKAPVEQGQSFWFVMYPRQVHSLRHVWTHPAFPNETT